MVLLFLGKDTVSQRGYLWVITEESVSDGMNMQAQEIAHHIEQKYGITIKLDILPIEVEERQVKLKQLRTEIMAGDGPDVYLLPVGDTLTVDHPVNNSTINIEPLFTDVNQAMRSGVFLDVNQYFSLDPELKPEIMEAGVLEGCRYVLPIRYDMPVLYSKSNQWESISTGVLVKSILQQNQPLQTVNTLLPDNLSLFYHILDYDKGEVTLTISEITEYMKLYQAQQIQIHASDILETVNLKYYNTLLWYISTNQYWISDGVEIFVGKLSDSFHVAAVSKALESDVFMFPLGDKVTADITYYGAVGCSCEYPEIATAFLEEFLTEEYQWEYNRPRVSKPITKPGLRDPQTKGLVENSWPVRTVGSVEKLWDNLRYQHMDVGGDDAASRRDKIVNTHLTDLDVPILNIPIDNVRFQIVLEGDNSFSYLLGLLINKNGTATDVGIEGLAQDVWTNLWWHLAEG